MSVLRRLRASLLALALVVAAGTVGYVMLGFGVLEAVYQTITTISTVGFREVHPLDGTGQVFTIVLILTGTGTALYAFSVTLETLIEGTLSHHFGRRRMERDIASLKDHVIICGWGRVGRSLADQLAGSNTDVVVIDTSEFRLESVAKSVMGDATDDSILRAAGIDRAKALVAATDTDAANLFITLSAHNLCPDLMIVTRVRVQENEAKMIQAGATRVVNPQSIGGARMAAFVQQPHVTDFFDFVMHDENLEFHLEEIPVSARSPLAGVSLRDAEIRGRTGALILALRDINGRFNPNPGPDDCIAGGEVLIAIGTTEQLRRLTEVAGAR